MINLYSSTIGRWPRDEHSVVLLAISDVRELDFSGIQL
jgi:hypothetical protein